MNGGGKMEQERNNFKKWIILILVAVISFWTIHNLGTVGDFLGKIIDILFPFILGICIAFILNMPMNFFENKLSKLKTKKEKPILGKKIKRAISFILAIIAIVLILTLVINLIVPELLNVVNILIDNIPYYIEKLEELAQDMPSLEELIKEANLDIEKIKTELLNKIPNLLSSSIFLIGSVFSGVTTLIISLIFAVYILTGKEKIKKQFTRILYAYCHKEKADKIVNIGNITYKTFTNFFSVQCLEATILGTLCMIGMLILKIPYAVTIGILVGVTALIPIVGAFIGIIIGAILIASVDFVKVITFIIFVLLLQQFEGNVIYPRVVGNSVGLPSMLVLLAVSVGGSLFGIAGMLLAVPFASVIYTLIKIDVDKKCPIRDVS